MRERQEIKLVDTMPEYCTKPVLVLGCGNILFGDDGFGPAVIERILDEKEIPGNACFINAGSSAREVLFDVALSERKPQRIIVIDAMECAAEPGAVVELGIEEIPQKKLDDFSMHQILTSNLLRELKDLCGVEVRLVVLHPVNIPGEVSPGLSVAALNAVEKAAGLVLDMCALQKSKMRSL